MTGIYCIKNLITLQVYIGISIDIQKRWVQHKRNLNKNQHCNTKLQNAWNKYGEDNFAFEVLEECSYCQCFEKEIQYIQQFNSFDNGYNLTRGGDKGNSEYLEKTVYVYDLDGNFLMDFRSRNEAERQLDCHSIKECCLGTCNGGYSKTNQQWYQFSYDYSSKILPYQFKGRQRAVYQLDEKGIVLNTFISGAEACRFLKVSAVGDKLRLAIKTHKPYHGFYWEYIDNYTSDWKPFDNKKIIAFDLEGNEIGRYHSATDAANQLKCTTSGVCNILNGRRKTLHGYIFRYINED